MFGNKNRKQFEKLFLPHLDASYNLARYLCGGSTFDAEDIVQEAYLRAYRAFEEYTDNNSRAWILTITRNTCHSWMRKHNMNPCIPFDEDSNCAGVDTVLADSVSQLSPEQNAQIRCEQQTVRQAIESLPVEFREVTVLRELEDLSYREIGLVLGIPQGTVMSRLARARKKLRELLVNAKNRKDDELR